MTDQPDQQSKLHIDTDWKTQAQAEKQKLQEQMEQEKTGEPGAAGGPGQMPPADFKTLVSTMVSQALLYMGAIPDPQTGQRIAHLDLARHHIDMLGVIEDKTRGNLDEEEQKMVTETVHELRQHYLQFQSQLAAQQAQKAAGPGAPGGGLGMGGPGMGPGGPGPIKP